MTRGLLLSRELGFLRIGLAVPPLRIADIDFNVKSIIGMMHDAGRAGVQVLVFPEMAITAYTLGDLVQHRMLLSRAKEGLSRVMEEGREAPPMLVILGLPLEVNQQLFNCAAVLNGGRILGIVPKSYLPSYREFYEGRWFSPGKGFPVDHISLLGNTVPFGTDILFSLADIPDAVIGVEICEDLWVPLSPHEYQALTGATVLVNLSASNELISKADWRRTMIGSESGRCLAAYCYVSSGTGESSNDAVYGGDAIIAENGTILAESARLSPAPQLLIADVDLERLVHDRRLSNSFHLASRQEGKFRMTTAVVSDPLVDQLRRPLDAHPFVPRDPQQRAQRCREIFSMQVAALAQKLVSAGKAHLVLGVSGGLDSTLALLVAVKTMDYLGLPRQHVHAYSLPGFGTTARTRSNAVRLCRALGVSTEKVNIIHACRRHLRDLGHDGQPDIVFENVQARYRTEFLFNRANQLDGIVLGTGDLTEIAVGWCTFAGDHISHYHVNASVPKTLVRYLVKWVAEEEMPASPARKVLFDILQTPISPELLPPEEGKIRQKSEEIIGPVELIDFFLYLFVRSGTRPGKVLFLAEQARRAGLFDTRYTPEELVKWLKVFIGRFFASQFKRTCFPEGPKLGSVSLSPRSDWRMPSEAVARMWLEDVDAMQARLYGLD
ncbi:MAG: NAD(+) synthase [Dehalococcoidales bacterium]|nr:NAD(+) synthase [Dehalococcoidales bacterium]